MAQINEETLYESNNKKVNGKKEVTTSPVNSASVASNEDVSWKSVAIGGTVGIMMGAGSLKAAEVATTIVSKDDPAEADAEVATMVEAAANVISEAVESAASEAAEAAVNVADANVPVAEVDQNQSFSQAYAEARAEVGPGGVFEWHGNIYNTYTAEEWNAMSHEDKNQFAHNIRPEVYANVQPVEPDVPGPRPIDNEVHVVGSYVHEMSDGTVVGVRQIEYGGHAGEIWDVGNDGTAEIAVLDANDNGQIDEGEVLDLQTGRVLTTGNNPETAPDMPDYTNDPSFASNDPAQGDGMNDYMSDADVSSLV